MEQGAPTTQLSGLLHHCLGYLEDPGKISSSNVLSSLHRGGALSGGRRYVPQKRFPGDVSAEWFHNVLPRSGESVQETDLIVFIFRCKRATAYIYIYTHIYIHIYIYI